MRLYVRTTISLCHELTQIPTYRFAYIFMCTTHRSAYILKKIYSHKDNPPTHIGLFYTHIQMLVYTHMPMLYSHTDAPISANALWHEYTFISACVSVCVSLCAHTDASVHSFAFTKLQACMHILHTHLL